LPTSQSKKSRSLRLPRRAPRYDKNTKVLKGRHCSIAFRSGATLHCQQAGYPAWLLTTAHISPHSNYYYFITYCQSLAARPALRPAADALPNCVYRAFAGPRSVFPGEQMLEKGSGGRTSLIAVISHAATPLSKEKTPHGRKSHFASKSAFAKHTTRPVWQTASPSPGMNSSCTPGGRGRRPAGEAR